MKYEKDELVGRYYSKIRDIKLDKIKFDTLLKKVNAKGSWTGIIKNHDKQKDIFYLDTKIKPIHNKYGDIIGYILISFDITDKIKLKELNKKLQNQLLLTKDNVKEQQKQIDLLTTVASHWLEPLDGINQNIQNMKISNYDGQSIKNLISKIENESISLAKEIALFKDKYNKKQEKEELNLKIILEKIIKMLEDNNTQHKVVIHQTLEDVPIIHTYKNELTESIFALITNSLEAFKKKKIVKPILDIGLYLKNSKIVIQIIDNGGGIEDEIMRNIFNAYFSTKSQKGKGMGLYITKSFIEFDLKGKLFIENSNPIGYTTATIEIPLD
jgi:signal transduction histidine kinase